MAGTVETLLRGSGDGLKRRVPIAHLITDAYYREEREKVFRRAWLMIGDAADLPENGSYMVREVPTLNASILVVRGTDGTIRAFHNVCTHRGNKLAQDRGGCANAFTCRFHGWSFTTEGHLAVVTDERQFRDLDKSILGLKPVHMEIWGGRIFVNLDEKPRQSLREWLGPMHDQYDGYFEQHTRLVSREIETNCNWNLAINAFQEGYHTLYIHAASVPDYQGGPTNPERHRPYMEMFDRHQRYSAPSNPHHKVSQAEAVAWRYGRQMLPAFDGDMTGMPPGVNPSRAENWAFDVVQFFPNTLILFGNHWHIEMTFWPIDADRTVITGANYAYPAQNLGERLSQDFVLSRGRFIMREDLSTLEAQHDALKSGALTHIQLSQQEIALQHHYRVLADMMAEA
jgi:phenylpropionate dioxygenase-like ring-hydroxylating dioxygenase large terminal subunit